MLDIAYLKSLKQHYHDELTENILPFWLNNAKDTQAGGYHACLNRDGSVYEYDKVCMWYMGRIVWSFSHMYNELEPRQEYLDMATWGVEFIEKHAFMDTGDMYYSLTREGKPLEAKQDVYTELSTVLGYTEYARAMKDVHWYNRAKEIFQKVWDSFQEPGKAYQGFLPEGRAVRLFGHSMITLNVIQELRRFEPEAQWEEKIDICIATMLTKHFKEDQKALFEYVAWEGDELPGNTGRWINPGHMIEAGIFFIHESHTRNDPNLQKQGIDFIEWGFQWGWDKEFGGIYNDVDSKGMPIPTGRASVGSSKLWWQHAEALYGLLLAYVETEDHKFLLAYKAVHEYCSLHFADPVYGEWYATLDRRGNPVDFAKGTARKNTFHIVRNYFQAYRLLERIL